MKHVIRREEFSQNHLFTGHLHWVRLFSVLPRGLSFILSSALSWTSKRKILLALCLQITKEHKASPWVSAILASLVVWRGLCLVSLQLVVLCSCLSWPVSQSKTTMCFVYFPSAKSEIRTLISPFKEVGLFTKKMNEDHLLSWPRKAMFYKTIADLHNSWSNKSPWSLSVILCDPIGAANTDLKKSWPEGGEGDTTKNLKICF